MNRSPAKSESEARNYPFNNEKIGKMLEEVLESNKEGQKERREIINKLDGW